MDAKHTWKGLQPTSTPDAPGLSHYPQVRNLHQYETARAGTGKVSDSMGHLPVSHRDP